MVTAAPSALSGNPEVWFKSGLCQRVFHNLMLEYLLEKRGTSVPFVLLTPLGTAAQLCPR